MAENAAVPLNAAAGPRVAYSQIARTHYGACEKKIAAACLVDKRHELSAPFGQKCRFQIFVFQNDGVHLALFQRAGVHILHFVRESGGHVAVAYKQSLVLGKSRVAVSVPEIKLCEGRQRGSAVHILTRHCECCFSECGSHTNFLYVYFSSDVTLFMSPAPMTRIISPSFAAPFT